VIRVGGASEVEVKERKDRVDDAMHATRAAVEEGILQAAASPCCAPGEVLRKVRTQKRRPEEPASRSSARRSPGRRARSPSMREKTVRSSSARSSRGINTPTASTPERRVRQSRHQGHHRPTKVVRAALQNAASIAGLLITTEAMVAERPKKDSGAPAMPGGGMGRYGRHGLLERRQPK